VILARTIDQNYLEWNRKQKKRQVIFNQTEVL